MRICTCVGACKGKEGLAEGWQCALEIGYRCRDCGELREHCKCNSELLEACKGLYGLIADGTLVRDISQDHKSNWSIKAISIVQKLAAAEAVISKARKTQVESLEPLQQAHKEQRELVEWAMTLLCSATPNAKLLSEQHQQEWCQGFGKWFAEANTGIPSIKLDPNGVYVHLCEWLMDRQGRSIHRVDSSYRAIDAQTNWYADADTLPLLSDAVLNCPKSQ